MQFNYAKERKQFDEEWKKMRGEYRVAGMSEEDIQIMYEFDLMVFRQRRNGGKAESDIYGVDSF